MFFKGAPYGFIGNRVDPRTARAIAEALVSTDGDIEGTLERYFEVDRSSCLS